MRDSTSTASAQRATASASVGGGAAGDDVLQVHAQLEQLVEQRQADALLAVQFLAKLLIGPLRVAGEAVEAALHLVARLGHRLLEQLVLAIVHLAQGDDLLAQAEDGRGAQGRQPALGRRRLLAGRVGHEVVAHAAMVLTGRGW